MFISKKELTVFCAVFLLYTNVSALSVDTKYLTRTQNRKQLVLVACETNVTDECIRHMIQRFAGLLNICSSEHFSQFVLSTFTTASAPTCFCRP